MSVVHLHLETLEDRRLLSTLAPGGYQVLTTINAQGDTEYRLTRNGFHFGSIIQDPSGRVIERYHPDRRDENGWGTSHHIASFLADGDPSLGKVDDIRARASGIEIWVSGQVSSRPSPVGTWTWHAIVSYDLKTERVFGSGVRTVTLSQPLNALDADLNLERIASNFLTGVPRQTGPKGDTGDAQVVLVSYDPLGTPQDFSWRGDPPAHFPQDASQFLSFNVVGELNTVEAVGVKVALKPTFKLDVSSRSDTMIAGLQYAVAQSTNPFADNVGITPLIVHESTPATEFVFDFTFAARKPALAGFSDDFRRTDKNQFEGQAVDLARLHGNVAPWLASRGHFRVVNKALVAGGILSSARVNGITAADVTVSADIDVTTAGTKKIAGLLARGVYRALIVATANGAAAARIQVLKFGFWRTLASAPLTSPVGRLDFELTGTQLQLLFKGQTVLNITDQTFTGAGAVGIVGQYGKFDNFQVTVRD